MAETFLKAPGYSPGQNEPAELPYGHVLAAAGLDVHLLQAENGVTTGKQAHQALGAKIPIYTIRNKGIANKENKC